MSLRQGLTGRRLTSRLGAVVISALVWAPQVRAQAPVVEAGADSQSPPATTPAAPPGGNDVMVQLYLQLEQLQREIQDLRGTVEEQGYQLRRMQDEQRDRYLDLDRRLSVLTESTNRGPLVSPEASLSARNATPDTGGAETILGGPTNDTGDGPGIPTTLSTPESAAAVPANEQDLYRTALNLLLEENNYQESAALFQQYIDNFPAGRYITNAYYWQGEALILVGDYNRAKAVFSVILEDYPQDPKAAGALLKLGVAHSRLGDDELARQSWESLSAQYPESLTEIRAAQDYLSRLGN